MELINETTFEDMADYYAYTPFHLTIVVKEGEIGVHKEDTGEYGNSLDWITDWIEGKHKDGYYIAQGLYTTDRHMVTNDPYPIYEEETEVVLLELIPTGCDPNEEVPPSEATDLFDELTKENE